MKEIFILLIFKLTQYVMNGW